MGGHPLLALAFAKHLMLTLDGARGGTRERVRAQRVRPHDLREGVPLKLVLLHQSLKLKLRRGEARQNLRLGLLCQCRKVGLLTLRRVRPHLVGGDLIF